MSPLLVSPTTGAALVPDGHGLLRDIDGRRWPVIDDIPYLRVGRDALVEAATRRIAEGDRIGALALLLADQDDWWAGAAPEPEAVLRLVRERDRLSLRDAMACLAFDRVGDYFAHRWSDPTFLAGLALIEAHWRPTASAFELACGIGQYGRDLVRHGVAFTGADVVFSKLWLARHWVLPPEAKLVCFDAAAPWPIADTRFDLVFCHDAFYFLEPKPAILAALRGLAGASGRVALSHVHNSGADNQSSGRAVSLADMARLFPEGLIYDDAELTCALVEARVPRIRPLAELGGVEAFSVEDGGSRRTAVRALTEGLALPPRGAALRINPLYRPARGRPRCRLAVSALRDGICGPRHFSRPAVRRRSQGVPDRISRRRRPAPDPRRSPGSLVMTPLRWGIVGFGWVARDFMVPAIAAAGDRLVAVADPASAAQAEGRRLGAVTYADPVALVADVAVEAVYVATPNHLHRAAVEAAAAAARLCCAKSRSPRAWPTRNPPSRPAAAPACSMARPSISATIQRIACYATPLRRAASAS